MYTLMSTYVFMFMFNTVRTSLIILNSDNCAQRIPIHMKRGTDKSVVSVALRRSRYWPRAKPGIGVTRGSLRLGEGNRYDSGYRIDN